MRLARLSLLLLMLGALLLPQIGGAHGAQDPAAAAAGGRAAREVATYLVRTIREEALTIGKHQKRIVAIKPDGCPNGCQVQALIDEGTGRASAGPNERLVLRVKLVRRLRKEVRQDGRASAQLQLSVTDSKTGAVADAERTISLRN